MWFSCDWLWCLCLLWWRVWLWWLLILVCLICVEIFCLMLFSGLDWFICYWKLRRGCVVILMWVIIRWLLSWLFGVFMFRFCFLMWLRLWLLVIVLCSIGCGSWCIIIVFGIFFVWWFLRLVMGWFSSCCFIWLFILSLMWIVCWLICSG